jgi:hypothetical protein
MYRSRPILLALVLGVVAGCGEKVTKSDLPQEEKHILKLASLYSEFRSKNGGRSPKDADELKAFAKKLDPKELSARGIDDVEKAFISPRDNQPYKLIPPQGAKPVAKGGPPLPMVIIYEQTGVNGKRMVASGMGGGAFELDDAKLREYVPNP